MCLCCRLQDLHFCTFNTLPLLPFRYANVIPVPETRVLLKVTKDGRNCEYINANFVRGARNESKYYIATQVSSVPLITVCLFSRSTS